MMVRWLVLVVVIASSATQQVIADAYDHRYKYGDPVPLYVNKVGPFHNPSRVAVDKKEALGEVLNGDRLVTAPYKVDFLVEKDYGVACKKKLTKEDVALFRSAVTKDYYFQMYYDDLPVWGFLGKVDKDGKADPSEYKYFLFKHLHFEILYNKDRVIEINVRTDPNALADLTEDKEVDVEFMYTVKWKETQTPFEKRMEKYSQSSSLPHHLEIHWFSIINSCVTVLLLTGFLATILMRVLKNDFVKYAHDEEAADDQEETGWKYIHGDVFRFPKYKSLLAASIGSGTQLFTLTTFIFVLALVGVFYPYNRGALFTALVVIYALTSGIAGYTATSFYCQLEGRNWPVFATAALPLGTIVVIFLIWTLVTSPLLVLGGIAGKNSKAEFQAPVRTTKYPREIPPLPWYRGTLPQMAMAGFLPFSAIYIELYYIFASVWGHRIYTIYSILFIVFVILLLVTAFITVALTYFQLAAEDHQWWWRGLSFVVDQLACSSVVIAYTTIMPDQICQVLCKPPFSLGTWLASAMVSFSCLGLLVSVLLCSLSVTYTTQSSASSDFDGSLLCSTNCLQVGLLMVAGTVAQFMAYRPWMACLILVHSVDGISKRKLVSSTIKGVVEVENVRLFALTTEYSILKGGRSGCAAGKGVCWWCEGGGRGGVVMVGLGVGLKLKLTVSELKDYATNLDKLKSGLLMLSLEDNQKHESHKEDEKRQWVSVEIILMMGLN
ncbi:unnamed protein product [Camellia sinensis]